MEDLVIINAARTPIGALQGCFSKYSASQLGAIAIRGALEKSGITSEQVNEVYMGCVLQAGQGQAPARQAALGANISNSTPCTTINKMCGSGMKAVMLSCSTLLADSSAEIIVAGGMESMTNAPYLLNKARSGYRIGHDKIIDHMFLDGLEDAYDHGKLMGVFADQTAKKYNLSREKQDEFALRSLELAKTATQKNWHTDIVPVNDIITDEIPQKVKAEKIPQLKPVFTTDGTVTPANSSSISDGAAALVITTTSIASKLGIKPIAKIIGYCSAAQEPEWFTTAPVAAIKKLLSKTQLEISEIDLWEINEAFAVVTLAAIHDLSLDINKVNVQGGSCAMGHPIGASGARILCTLLSSLKRLDKKIGVASLCIGGGEATAMAIERIN